MNFEAKLHEAFDYLAEVKATIFLAIFVFAAGSIAGYLFAPNITFFDEFLKELASKVQGLNGPEIILFIFQNNVQSAFFAMILGLFLGVVPLFNGMMNGLILGYVYSKVSSTEGLLIIWRLIPHGIFELPAIMISLGLGMHLGGFFFAPRKKRKEVLVRRLKRSLEAFLFVVLPLLVIAAIIEGLLIVFAG